MENTQERGGQLYHQVKSLNGGRRETEEWLSRIESWLGQMRPVTDEGIEHQIQEQKVYIVYPYIIIV